MEEKRDSESRRHKKRKSSRERSSHHKRRHSPSESLRDSEDRKEKHRHHSRSKSSHRHSKHAHDVEERKSHKHGHEKHSGHKHHHHRHHRRRDDGGKEVEQPKEEGPKPAEPAKSSDQSSPTKTNGEPTPVLSTVSPPPVAVQVPNPEAAPATAATMPAGSSLFDDDSRSRTLIHYVNERERMLKEAFSVLTGSAVDRMLPRQLQGVSLAKIKELCQKQITQLSEEQLRAVIEEGRLFTEEELGFEPPKPVAVVQDAQVDSPASTETVVAVEEPLAARRGNVRTSPPPAIASSLSTRSLSDEGECALVEVMVAENLFDDDTPAQATAVPADSTSQVSAADRMSLTDLQRRRRELEAELEAARKVPTSSARPARKVTAMSAPARGLMTKTKESSVVVVMSSPDQSPARTKGGNEPRAATTTSTPGCSSGTRREIRLSEESVMDKPAPSPASPALSEGSRTDSVADEENGHRTDSNSRADMEKEEQRLRLRALKSMNKRLLEQRGKPLQ